MLSSTLCVVLTLLGLARASPFPWPVPWHAHVDPDFRRNCFGLLALLVTAKTYTFANYIQAA